MKKEIKRKFLPSICMLSAFVLWTLLICFVDVQAIGPQETKVGFATVNRFVHNLTGVNMYLYTITDWLSIIPIVIVIGFGVLGLIQWIKRKCISRVDYSILVLGGFYTVVMAVYVFFETVAVNYRPILINGCTEASYPSSTTTLVMCVMPTAHMQFNSRIKNENLKRCVVFAAFAFIAFMVIGRLVSGVHWLTDIIGGALLSAGLVLMYRAIVSLKEERDVTP